eukprot:s2695_g5.t1
MGYASVSIIVDGVSMATCRVFEEGFTPTDRGLTEEEITAYLMTRTNAVEVRITGSKAEWDVWASETPWLQEHRPGLMTLASSEGCFADIKVGPVCFLEVPKEKRGLALLSEYKASRGAIVTTLPNGSDVVLRFRETQAALQNRLERVDRLPAKDVQTLNLGGEWYEAQQDARNIPATLSGTHVQTVHFKFARAANQTPASLQKIDRVTFGIMTDEQVKAALAEQPLMPLTRSKLAIPFVGLPWDASLSLTELGLTSFAYRYEGLRRSDFDEVMSALADRLENEGGGSQLERPTALRWKSWVEEAGAVFCVKQREMDERAATEDSWCSDSIICKMTVTTYHVSLTSMFCANILVNNLIVEVVHANQAASASQPATATGAATRIVTYW